MRLPFATRGCWAVFALAAASALAPAGASTAPPAPPAATPPSDVAAGLAADLAALRRAAEGGDVDAQYRLGRAHFMADGGAPDAAQALRWTRRAAEQGHAPAQFLLGYLLEFGKGVAVDEAQAALWYRKAAEQGEPMAQSALGNLLEHGSGVAKDEAQAIDWYRKAAQQGDRFAQSKLGERLALGRGVAKDEVQAVMWMRKAAEQGDADAQFNLGVMLARGRGLAKDAAQAASWYRKAALQGHRGAQHNLGLLLETGEGVAPDAQQAAHWYDQAARQGHARARERLDALQGRAPTSRPPAAAAPAAPAALHTAPALADFLPAPPAALADAVVPCAAGGLRAAPELGTLDEAKDARLQLLRAWGQRRLRWQGEGCIDWGRVVRAWQQTNGQAANGVLGATDLERLQAARIGGFAAYREALAAWQQGRSAVINTVAERGLPELPVELLRPRSADALAGSAAYAAQVQLQSAQALDLGCDNAHLDTAAAVRCKGLIDAGRMPADRLGAAHRLIGTRYHRLGDAPRALRHLTRSLQANPRDAEMLRYRAMVLRQLGALAPAQADLDALIELLRQKEQAALQQAGDRLHLLTARFGLAQAFEDRAALMRAAGNPAAANDDEAEALRYRDEAHDLPSR